MALVRNFVMIKRNKNFKKWSGKAAWKASCGT